jgi:hypothetical protein
MTFTENVLAFAGTNQVRYEITLTPGHMNLFTIVNKYDMHILNLNEIFNRFMFKLIHPYRHICIYIYIYIYISMNMSMYTYICTCRCVFIHIHIYICSLAQTRRLKQCVLI